MKKVKHNKSAQPHPLFAEWAHVARRVRAAKTVNLFLDFDGTLVGFKKNPAEVRLEASTRRLLERLAQRPRVMLVFISGRRRADLRRRVGVKGALYLGLHGLESRGAARVSAGSRRSVLLAYHLIAEQTQGLPDIGLEDKQASLVVRYRGATVAAAAKALAAARTALETPGVRLSVLRGKKILELLAPEVEGKGAAAAEIVRRAGPGALPVYVGDDATDETAFAALDCAITVKVGNSRRTQARYCVRNPDEVKIFLERLDDVLR